MVERTNVRRLAKSGTISALLAIGAVIIYAILYPRYEVDHTKWYGVHWHPTWQDADFQELDLAKSAGAEMIRIGVSWRLMEPTQGKWDENWYMSALDQRIDYATKNGTAVLLMLGENPCWASPQQDACQIQNWDFWCPIGSEDAYANAMVHLVQRYGNNSLVVGYEVWNEPNGHYFWCNAPNVEQYVTLLKVTYEAVKAENPNMLVLGGSLAGTEMAYLNLMYRLDAQNYYDALAIHPYSGVTGPDECVNIRWSFECGMDKVVEIMAKNSDSDPIWLTEVGWSSFDGQQGVSKWEQARYLREMLTILNQKDWNVPVVIWYDLIDQAEQSDNRLGYFGLFNTDMEPKRIERFFPQHPTPEPYPADS